MSDTATIEPAVETPPAPGTPAAFAAAGDARGFMAAREAQLRGTAPPPAPAEPAAEPVEPVEAAVEPVEGQDPPAAGPAAGDPAAQTEEERAAAEEAAKTSEAARVLNEAKKRKSRPDELRAEIDDLTYRKHRAREAAEAEQQRLDAVRAERERIERDAAARPAAPVAPTTPKPQITDAAAPGYFPGTYEDFVEALTDWKLEQKEAASAGKVEQAVEKRLRAEQEAAAQRQQQAANDQTLAAHNSRVAEFVKVKADYAEVMQAASTDPIRSQLPAVIGGYMIQSDMGPQLAYELATMPLDEFRKIQSLPPDLALAAVGRLEGRLSARTASHPPGPTPPRNPVNPAARPVSPVRSSAPVTAIPSQELAKTDPIAFMRQRDLDERKRKYGR